MDRCQVCAPQCGWRDLDLDQSNADKEITFEFN